MPARPLDILLLRDASNCHRALATGLRALGHEVTVASEGSGWMDTERDIDLSRRLPGKLGGLWLWTRLQAGLKRRLTGHDIVSVAGQGFLDLRPHRIRAIFDYLLPRNRGVFLTALETDPNYIGECLDPDTELQYNEFRIFGKPSPYALERPEILAAWQGPELTDYSRHFYSHIDGAVPVLWEYDVALRRTLPPDRIAYGGIPIETSAITPVHLPDRIGKVRLFLGRHRGRLTEKGTDILEVAARAVAERHPDKAELVIVENRPYREYLEILRSAHVVLDQLYSYTPATNALLAMAMGLNTVSGGDERYYRFIGEESMRPVIHVEPDYESVFGQLEKTVLDPASIRPRGLEGREFVVKHNDCVTVARRFLSFWQRRLAEKESAL